MHAALYWRGGDHALGYLAGEVAAIAVRRCERHGRTDRNGRATSSGRPISSSSIQSKRYCLTISLDSGRLLTHHNHGNETMTSSQTAARILDLSIMSAALLFLAAILIVTTFS